MRLGARERGESTRQSQRAVSPVIGVVLMIAITVSLAVVAAPFVFATAGEGPDQTPTVDFGFHYDEVSHQQADTFGVTPADSGTEAAGLLTITVDSGDAIPASELEIEATASGGQLTDSPQFGAEDELESGESLTLWVERGETIDVVWRDGEDNAVLGSFTIRPEDTPLPPGVPQPQHGCEYIEDELEDGPDVDVQNTVVRCDLTEENVGLIEDLTINSAAVIGEIDVNGTVSMTGGETYLGDVAAGDALQMDSESSINGDAVAGGDIDIQGDSTVDGTVTGADGSALSVTDSMIKQGATTGNDVSLSNGVIGGAVETTDGSVTLGTESAIGGTLTAENAGNVDLDSSSVVSGTVTTGDGTALDLDSSSEIGGDIVAAEDSGVQIVGGSKVDGSITVEESGTVTLDDGSSVGDGITTGDGSSVDLEQYSTVGGTIDSGSNVETTDTIIGGDVFVDGSLTCTNNNTTINGESCSAYKQPEHHVGIASTDSPATNDGILEVAANVTNERFEGSEAIDLSVDGDQKDAQSVELSKGASTQLTLRWDLSAESVSTGQYVATVRSESGFEDSTPISVTDGSGPIFDVTVDSYTDEVFENQTVDVSATIENVGDSDGSQDIELYDFTGNLVDGVPGLSLAAGDNTSVSLAWDTTGTDPDTGEISIESDSETVTKEATVKEATYVIDSVDVSSVGSDLGLDIDATSNDPDAEMRVRVNRSKNNNDDEILAEATYDVKDQDPQYNVNKNKVDYVTVEIFDGEGTVRAGTTVEYD
jgi:flagellin-like protein